MVNALYDAHERDFDAALINPAGYTTGTGPLLGAIGQVKFPVYEVHVSNPTARGTVSKVLPVSKVACTVSESTATTWPWRRSNGRSKVRRVI